MKILILRGGAGRRRAAAGAANAHEAGASTRERGVMALGNGNGHWVLVNMSPGVAHQLDSDPRLDHHLGLPDAGVRAVVLTDAQVDHVGGLLSLRDGPPIDLYATPAVFEQLTTALPVLPVLQHYCGVHWHVVPVAGDRRVASFRVNGLPELEFTAVATRSPPPPHLAHGDGPQVGDSIALAVRDLATGQRVFCAPGLAQIGETEFEWMREADCLLLDHLPLALAATPVQADRAAPTAARADAPAAAQTADDAAIDAAKDAATHAARHAAAQDWLQRLGRLPARHKVLFGGLVGAVDPAHWAEQGISLAYDGMEIDL